MYEKSKLGRNEKLEFCIRSKCNEYTEDVTLENSCFDSIVQFSFGIADCCKMSGAGSGRYNSSRPIFTVAPLSSGRTARSWKINGLSC